jgi:nicotinamide-nucleotide amidase
MSDLPEKKVFTVAVAESLTAGNAQSLISQHSGVSAWFQGGVTTYNIDMKVNLLGVDRQNAEKCDCVSERTAMEMAQGVCKLMNSDMGIATTGYVSKNDQTDVPMAWIAIAVNGVVDTVKLSMDVSKIEHVERKAIQRCFAQKALSTAYRMLVAMKKSDKMMDQKYSDTTHLFATMKTITEMKIPFMKNIKITDSASYY